METVDESLYPQTTYVAETQNDIEKIVAFMIEFTKDTSTATSIDLPIYRPALEARSSTEEDLIKGNKSFFEEYNKKNIHYNN